VGSQGLDPDGGRALMGRSDGVCSPRGPGELSRARWAPVRCRPGRQHHAPAGKQGTSLALLKGLSALALLDKQDRAERTQRPGRGPSGISASPQALLRPGSRLAAREDPAPSPTASPSPARSPAAHPAARPGAGRGDSASRGGIRPQHRGRQGRRKPPPSVLHGRSITYPCSADGSDEQRPAAPSPDPALLKPRQPREEELCEEGAKELG